MNRKRIAIVGLGLIGGSLAIQLNEKGLGIASDWSRSKSGSCTKSAGAWFGR